mmetsp:Transcript_8251/g.16024  ORF Transcript_8251/g.16024 Transcript_8251/m.16024 type:complete len:217 (-) Transcript_8251:75-725(-)
MISSMLAWARSTSTADVRNSRLCTALAQSRSACSAAASSSFAMSASSTAAIALVTIGTNMLRLPSELRVLRSRWRTRSMRCLLLSPKPVPRITTSVPGRWCCSSGMNLDWMSRIDSSERAEATTTAKSVPGKHSGRKRAYFTSPDVSHSDTVTRALPSTSVTSAASPMPVGLAVHTGSGTPSKLIFNRVFPTPEEPTKTTLSFPPRAATAAKLQLT